MIPLDRELCVCNDLSMKECVALIKEKGATTIDEVVTQCHIGDKCESCHEDGYENDGFSIAMTLSLIKQNRV